MAKTKTAPAPKLTIAEPGQPASAPVVDQRFETEQARRRWTQFDRITYVEGNGPDDGTLHISSGWGKGFVEVEFWIEPKGKSVEMGSVVWGKFKERVDRITLNCQRMLVFESFELTYSLLTAQPQTYHKLANGHKLRAIETIAMDGSFNTFIIEASKKLKLQGLAIAGYFNEWRDSYRPSVS